jgi:predicted nucleic acid-binding protein
MIILDTNVLSELMRLQPDSTVLKWLDLQPASSIWTTSITLMESRAGLKFLPAGRRRELLARELEAVFREDIAGRIAPFDAAAAEHAAELSALQRVRGRTVDLRDAMIAEIVISTGATLATRNLSQFSDLPNNVVNPWSS